MPKWWSINQWKAQYPEDEVIHCNCDIEYLKEKYKPDSKICYCPDLATPRKSGQSPKSKRIKGAIETALVKNKNERKKN